MKSFSILLIEKKISVATILTQILCQQLNSFQLRIIKHIADARGKESSSVDMILLNLTQIDSNGSDFSLLTGLKQIYPDTPITLLIPPKTEIEEELLLQALAKGADDYISLSKAGLLLLSRRVSQQHQLWQENQKRSHKIFLETLNEFLPYTEDTPLPAIQLISPNNTIQLWNRAAEQLFGLEERVTFEQPLDDLPLLPENLSRLKDIVDQARLTEQPFCIPAYPLQNAQREIRWVRTYACPNPNSQAIGLISVEITDFKQIESENERRNQELHDLLNFRRNISGQLELSPTAEKIIEQTQILLDIDHCYLYFLEKDNVTIRPVLDSYAELLEEPGKLLRVGEGILGHVVATGEARIHSSNDEVYFLIAPLTAFQGTIGLMVVQRNQPPPFTENDLRFFENLVQQSSFTINNARFFEETQRHLNELSTLYEANRTISTTWKTQELLDILIRQMVEAIEVHSGHIVSWDKKQGKGIVRAKFPKDDERVLTTDETKLGYSFDLTARPALSSIIKQQRPVFFHLNRPSLDQTERKSMQKSGCHSRLLIPLVIKNETIGWAELWEMSPNRTFLVSTIRMARMLANQAAVALENAQYLNQLQRNLEETTALYHVASALTISQDAQATMGIVLYEYLHTIGLKQGSVIIFDFENKWGIVKIHIHETYNTKPLHDHHHNNDLEGHLIPLEDDPIYRRLMRTRWPVMVENINAEWKSHYRFSAQNAPPLIVGNWASQGALSILAIPIQIRGEIVGVMVAEESRYHRTFDTGEITLGQGMADQLGMALHNAHLYELEQERRQEAETLREVSSIVGSSLKLNEVLERILSQLRRVVEYDSSSIQLIEGKERRIIAGRGFPHPEKIIGLTFPSQFDKNEPGSIATHQRKPLILSEAENFYNAFKGIHSHIKSWIGLPLIARDKVIGLITIDNTAPNAYTEEDARLAMAFANQVAVALENARLYEVEVRQIEYELKIANEIQETLLPHSAPDFPDLQIHGCTIPARQIGGDFYDFFLIDEDQLCVAIGDVSGKGIPAALFMAVAITAIEGQVKQYPTPSRLLNKLNDNLYPRLQASKMNIGLQIATFRPFPPRSYISDYTETSSNSFLMTIASAGMISPIGATPHSARFLPVSGLPIGVYPSSEHTYRGDEFLLAPNSIIIFTSDGIVEAKNEHEELFGFERLEETINEITPTRNAQTIAEYIIQAAKDFMGEAEQSDDMTVLVVVKR